MKEEYKNIAAYEGQEIPDALSRILKSDDFLSWFRRTTGHRFPTLLRYTVVGLLRLSRNPLRRMDHLLVMPFLHHIEKQSCTSLSISGTEYIGPEGAFLMTNHRDIILDAAFLCLLLRRHGNGDCRPYLGVGNNLFGKPWIEDLMRVCRCFTVVRNGGGKEVMKNAAILSSYLSELQGRSESIWMAQRQGRAKDGNDLTQPAVLKMLTLAEEGSLLERVRQLRITPVSITYEYDPCDWLKAREMQLMRDNADYRKTAREDMKNMQTGLKGQKGEVHFVITPCINDELNTIDETTSRNEQLAAIAAIIDRHIHRGYHLAWTNISAKTILEGGEDPRMEEYIKSRIELIQIPNRDDQFLRQCLLTMYANPAINQAASQK